VKRAHVDAVKDETAMRFCEELVLSLTLFLPNGEQTMITSQTRVESL
jgi:hypothetical protein